MKPPPSIPWATPVLWGREEALVVDALRSTWISGGPYVERFEKELTGLLGVRFGCAVSNGTAALHCAYLALGIAAGDEIIVPGFAFMAAANIALHLGAVPVYAEVDGATWCLSADTIEPKLSPRTRAVVVVHSYGNMCDMEPILALARRAGVPVVEDAAEAFGSSHRGRQAGALGTIGVYSFHATKTITTGEGGLVVTNDPRLNDRVALYRSHGMLRKRHYWHELPGHNFRLTNLQAALGCAQLEKLDVIRRERARVHERYRAVLSRLEGVTLQRFAPGVDAVVWATAIKLDPAAFPQGRDAVMEQMQGVGIETRPGFYAASTMELYRAPALPVCEELSRQVISLPTYPTLADAQIDSICAALSGIRR